MKVIKAFDVLSCAKMMGAVYGVIGLLVIPFVLVAGFVGLASGQRSGLAGGIAIMVVGILAPFFYGGLGFIFGALGAWVYNLMAKWLGGIQVTIQDAAINPSTNQVGLI